VFFFSIILTLSLAISQIFFKNYVAEFSGFFYLFKWEQIWFYILFNCFI